MSVADLGPCQKELTIEVAAEGIAAAREEVLRHLQKVAQVPGFRVGYAPRPLVEERYGLKAREETIRRVIGDHLPKALEQLQLDVLGDPQVTKVRWDANGKPLQFTVRCEIMPAVPLQGVAGLKVKRPAVQVTESQVEEILTQLQERHAELVPVEPRPLAAGDYAVVNFTCAVEGKVIEQRTAVALPIDPEKDSSGMSRHLVGVAPGPTPVTFETTLPQDLSAKNYAGRRATFSVVVKEVKAKRVPPLEEDFAKLLGAESLQTLKTRLQESLKRDLETEARQAMREQVIQALLERTPFEVPPSLVQSQAQRLLREATLKLLTQGVAPDELEARRDLLVDQSKQNALRQVKVFFLLRQVANAHGLTATEAQVTEHLQALATRLNRPPNAVRADLEQRGLMGELAWEITRGKVLDFLLKQADIIDQ